MIDNYDSFTWNLVQYLQAMGAGVKGMVCPGVRMAKACCGVEASGACRSGVSRDPSSASHQSVGAT